MNVPMTLKKSDKIGEIIKTYTIPMVLQLLEQ